MKTIIVFLIKAYLTIVLRGKEVYLVSGMRRSGNHAFINWFSSALEGGDVELEKILDDVYQSKSKKTLLLNEVNFRGVQCFIKRLRSIKPLIKESKYVFISLEDYDPVNVNPYAPFKVKKISIVRSTLNLIASRLQRAINQAKNGLDRGDMAIDKKFIYRLKSLRKAKEKGWYIWSYDAWSKGENDYRKNFLKQFDLKFDSNPEVSSFGGGSSFTGKHEVPDYKAAANRWEQVVWPKRVLLLLSEKDSEELLVDEEKEFVCFLLNDDVS